MGRAIVSMDERKGGLACPPCVVEQGTHLPQVNMPPLQITYMLSFGMKSSFLTRLWCSKIMFNGLLQRMNPTSNGTRMQCIQAATLPIMVMDFMNVRTPNTQMISPHLFLARSMAPPFPLLTYFLPPRFSRSLNSLPFST